MNYLTNQLFEDFDVALSNFGLEQLIDFVTWSRLVNNICKSSVLDHVYVTDRTSISNIQSLKPIFGDHLLVHFDTNIPKQESKKSMRRDWRGYSKDALSSSLSNIEWRLGVEGVQQYWKI